MKIEVKQYKKFDKEQSNLVAFMTLYLTEMDLYISDCKLIRMRNGGFFIGLPSRQFKDEATGEVKYSPYVLFGKNKNEEFQKSAIEAVTHYAKDSSVNQVAHLNKGSTHDNQGTAKDYMDDLPF